MTSSPLRWPSNSISIFYHKQKNGSPGASRTHNLLLRTEPLYPLSYWATPLYYTTQSKPTEAGLRLLVVDVVVFNSVRPVDCGLIDDIELASWASVVHFLNSNALAWIDTDDDTDVAIATS